MSALPHCQVGDKQERIYERGYIILGIATCTTCDSLFENFSSFNKTYRYIRGSSRKVPGSIPDGVTGDFFHDIQKCHVPGVDSASKNKDTPGGKDGLCVWLTT
jgi:hypothetical protein